jgi:hypothetical protein
MRSVTPRSTRAKQGEQLAYLLFLKMTDIGLNRDFEGTGSSALTAANTSSTAACF